MPLVIAERVWRFASAVARPRTEPATALAPLSHMLSRGFFFVHGFFITAFLSRRHKRQHLACRARNQVGHHCRRRFMRMAITKKVAAMQGLRRWLQLLAFLGCMSPLAQAALDCGTDRNAVKYTAQVGSSRFKGEVGSGMGFVACMRPADPAPPSTPCALGGKRTVLVAHSTNTGLAERR